MASGDFVASARQKIRIGDVESNRPNSEAVNSKISGSVNYLLDNVFFDLKFPYIGYFRNNAYDQGYPGIEVIERDCQVSRYFMAINKTGTSGTNNLNVAIYEQNGTFVGNLFGAGALALSVSGSNGTNVVVGRQGLDTITPSDILVNTAGHTVFTGDIQVTTLLAGYVLVPYVEDSGVDALNANLVLRCKEI